MFCFKKANVLFHHVADEIPFTKWMAPKKAALICNWFFLHVYKLELNICEFSYEIDWLISIKFIKLSLHHFIVSEIVTIHCAHFLTQLVATLLKKKFNAQIGSLLLNKISVFFSFLPIELLTGSNWRACLCSFFLLF